MLLRWVLVALFLLQGSDTPDPNLWLDNNEIWLLTRPGPQQLTRDGFPKRLPILSPDSKRIAYVVDQWLPNVPRTESGGEGEDVVEIDTAGSLLRHIIPEGYIPGRFDRLEWIDNRRLGAMTCGHANCFYWILDADNGKTLKTMEGGFDFIWSHDGRWVARRTVADFVRNGKGEEFDNLLLNEAETYPPPNGEDLTAFTTPPLHIPPHGHSFGPFAWSPDDAWVAFTDTETPERNAYVVVVSPNRQTTLRETVPAPVKYDTIIVWEDATHLQLTAQGQTLKFVVNESELQQVTGAR
jgi:hypothetical protein